MRSSLIRGAAISWLAMLAANCAERRPAEPIVAPSAERAPSPPPHAAQADLTLSILGLNDLHGRLRALPAFVGYVTNLRRARAADGGAVALVDAGDMFQGTLESNLTEGASVISAYRVLGMTVATLGNHEFDFGPVGDTSLGDPQGAIRQRIAEAAFPILSANLVLRGSHDLPNWDKLRRSAIVTVGAVRVGFVGLLTRETPSIVNASCFVGLDVDELAPALEREARALRGAGAEVVVGVAHAGADCGDYHDPNDLSSCTSDAEIFEVARAMPSGLVDAIFAGHSHAGVAQIVNGIPIAEAFARGRAFSRIDLRLDGATHHVLSRQVFPPRDLCPKLADGGDCPLRDYEGQATVEDPQLIAAIAPALERVEARRKVQLGSSLTEPFLGAHDRESPLGNLFVDLIREAVPGADVAILNGGSLRADLPAGPLDYGALYEAMPFDNALATVRMTGAELKRVLTEHLSHDAHGFVSLSGLRVDARCGHSGLEVTLRRPSGKLVSDQETLLLATSDYLANGGDNLFSALKLAPDRIRIEPGSSFRDALAGSVSHHPQLSPRDPARFNPKNPRLSTSTPRPVQCLH
jgi:2',3'-cyclic-nucleotide 2'-phosphodiesterase (5'-nucleotidase family)